MKKMKSRYATNSLKKDLQTGDRWNFSMHKYYKLSFLRKRQHWFLIKYMYTYLLNINHVILIWLVRDKLYLHQYIITYLMVMNKGPSLSNHWLYLPERNLIYYN